MSKSTPSIASKHRASKPRLTALQKRLLDAGMSEIRKALDALARYERRHGRQEHPDGYFDNASRWYPSVTENAGYVSSSFRSPSRAYPLSYMKACRSLNHCEILEDADHDVVLDIRRELRVAGLSDTFSAALEPAFMEHLERLEPLRLSEALALAATPIRARARL